MIAHSNPILSSVIVISEKLKGSKLKDSVLSEIDEQLNTLSSFLNLDKTESLFFALFFSLYNQENKSVTFQQIADYLNYPFLLLLEYRYVVDLLEEKDFISLNARYNVSRNTENNGYIVSGSVSNSIIDGIEIPFPKKEKSTLEDVISEIFSIAKNFKYNVINDTEYTRQILIFERKNQHIDLIRNITTKFSKDFNSRIILYYFSYYTIFGEEIAEPVYERRIVRTHFFDYLSNEARKKRKRDFYSGTDILLKENILEQTWNEDLRYGNILSYRFTKKGIKSFFGKDSKKYSRDEKKTELDLIILGINEMSFTYEDNLYLSYKLRVLSQIEKRYQKYQYFKKVRELIKDKISRFIYLECVNDFVNGYESDLGVTLQDIYGHGADYFSTLRKFLDEKHFLVETGLIEIKQNEIAERTKMTLTDKSIELLYGENADLYKVKNNFKNVLLSENIKEKDLFYEVNVQNQIDMLYSSLSQDNLMNIQKRLEEKGLTKGVAVILYGAPGTGKTETVYQLAKKTNRKIMHVDISESKSMWFGESEKCIKNIFNNYRSLCKVCKNHNENTPILLFNEADAIISKRGSIDEGGPRQTENAMQNILLEEMEKLEGILIATTNLCENMDSAFERRFLFKIKFDKPTVESRSKIWMNKLESISSEDAYSLAEQFDFSGGEIDNIARKCEMNEIIYGSKPDYEQLVIICRQERLEKEGEQRIGFFC